MLNQTLSALYVISILIIAGCGKVVTVQPDAAVAIDATDADNGGRQFEVIYISDLSVSSTLFTTGNMSVVVNRGTVPLDLSKARIVTTTDDNPQATFGMSLTISNTALSPNHGAGDLSPAAKALIIDSGMVTEDRTDLQYSMSISLLNTPAGDYKVTASAILEIDAIQVEIPISFQHGASVSFNGVNRVLSCRSVIGTNPMPEQYSLSNATNADALCSP